jgi:hypothetical protein
VSRREPNLFAPLLLSASANLIRTIRDGFCCCADRKPRPIRDDGSFAWPSQSLTARNAVASTFGLSGAEYMPEVET